MVLRRIMQGQITKLAEKDLLWRGGFSKPYRNLLLCSDGRPCRRRRGGNGLVDLATSFHAVFSNFFRVSWEGLVDLVGRYSLVFHEF